MVTGLSLKPTITHYRMQGADIVFLEYTMNDGAGISKEGEAGVEIDIPSRRGTERLLRRLLSFENRPAVVVLHAWYASLPVWSPAACL